MTMDYRHEWKHQLNYGDFAALRHRLRSALPHDVHVGPDGTYHIRSLYFDTPGDRALREKLDGVNCREKFRIRVYNGSDAYIRLEKKSRRDSLGNKTSAVLTRGEAQAVVDGDLDWMACHREELVRELYHKMLYERLSPRTIVDYRREPFIFAPGNVRVTLDWDLRTGLRHTDLLDPAYPTVPAGEPVYLLEVKYDQFLPDLIRDLVQLESRPAAAFSKYARCRIYG